MAKGPTSRERSQETQPQDYATAYLAALLESTQDLIWSVDLNHHLVTSNKGLSDAFARRYDANMAAGITPRDLLLPENAAVFPPLYEKALREGLCSAEYRLSDGCYLELTFSPIIQDGQKVGVSVFGKDVTEQKSAKEALRKTAEQYREIFEFAPEAIFRITEEGKTLAINPAGAKLLGYDSPAEAIFVLNDWGRQVWFDPAERAAFIGVLDQRREASSGPRQFKRKDGMLFWGIVTERRIRGPGGKTLYYQGFIEDITERKQAVDALRASEVRLKEAEHLAMFGNSTWDAETDTTTWSEGLYRITGRDPSTPPPHHAERTKLYTPESFALWDAAVRHALSTGDPYDLELQIVRADGALRWTRARGGAVRNQSGRVCKLIGTLQDITDQKALQVDLAAKVRELQVLSEMNSALLHAKTEEELLTEYCRIVVEAGGYRMAWVGFAEEGPEKRILPVAHYGHEDGYLKIANRTWADTERGQGPAARCIRTGEITVVRDFAADPTTALWREEGAKRGYMSCISIPFRQFESEKACLTAYGVRVSRWSDPERRLMDQVASALGYGIGTLRTALAKAQHQESLRVSLEQTIQVIAETVDQRDPYTAGHQRRVADLCVAIAGKLGLSSQRTQGLRLAAGIHDLGKIGIPAEILAKPGRLTENQFNLIKEHAQLGYEIVKSVQFPWPIAQMILQHHERLDGSGYPRGLKADEIFLESRILAVADVVEAMSSHRPYRPSRGIKVALDEVLSKSGALYDPEAVEACVNLFRREGYQFPRQ